MLSQSSGKLPIHDDNSQQVFTITAAVELSQTENETPRENNFNKHRDQDGSVDSVLPLPPKPLAGYAICMESYDHGYTWV